MHTVEPEGTLVRALFSGETERITKPLHGLIEIAADRLRTGNDRNAGQCMPDFTQVLTTGLGEGCVGAMPTVSDSSIAARVRMLNRIEAVLAIRYP